MISFNKHYINLAQSNFDIQQKYLQNVPDDEAPQQCIQQYDLKNPVDVKYGYKDNQSLLFEIHKNLPHQPDFKIGVDLIYLIDINQTLNDEALEKMKSALKCLINYLTEQDRLCIIIYNNKADKLFPLIPLNEKNRQIILQKIDQITLQKGNSNILNALLVANLCLKLRQYKNQITSINVISQDVEIQQNNHDFKQIFEKELVFKLKTFLLLSNKQQESPKIKKKPGNTKDGNLQIVKSVDQLSSLLCYQATKLQQSVIKNLLIIVKTHKQCPIQLSEQEGGKFQYVNPYEIRISKNLISFGYNKVHLISLKNSPIIEADQICEIEVSFEQTTSNHRQKYLIPINTQKSNGIIDRSVMVDKYRLKSRSQMNEAIIYYDPHRIQDSTEILKNYLSELANLPDDIKQQLTVETKQFDDALQKYLQNPFQQIQNPFIAIDDLKKQQRLKPFDNH
ncbi:unnamed protein product (macronuclear) [Paramecium tetraurelia]|uniref:VWFA domain-containing protein n=1 Tax=Paramecium tetraurelia TaxID=5888 RepID=A0DPH7_PARTE|nr:uncharacterized protein GSPATT00019126001 [Paramecium tetraurelia]CAK84944.1 unnamed protein product [Paramecium tetraurelia]|eukprot:XP_001452341.1 hypothetical protein (macronuclear) [Paramecium tetraurelia strain d4-2]